MSDSIHKDVESAADHSEKPVTDLTEDVADAGFAKVLARHGRIDLEPMPSDDPNDPLNWPAWQKNTLLVLVSIHACMGPFSAAATIPAFLSFVEEFGISITSASYTVSIIIIFIGCFPLLWSPISNRIGRRPVFLISTLVSAGLAFACAYCTSYGSLMAVRALQAIFICPPQSIGAACVTEMFFTHERGQKLGVWALLVALGPPLAPFIMGFLVYNKSWHWIFYLLSIIFLAEFILYIPFGRETLYQRKPREHGVDTAVAEAKPAKWYTPYVTFKRHSKEPWSKVPIEMISPLRMFFQLPVILAASIYAVTFTYSNVLLTIETPALLGVKYELNAQQQGLQFIAYLIGALLGEPIAGYGSDKYMAWRTKRNGGTRIAENRLPVALPGTILVPVGIIIFFVQLNNTPAGKWNVTPLIGGAIAMFGLQLITTVCQTYAVDTQAIKSPQSGKDAALFVAFWRQLYAFTGPFYYVQAFENLGISGAGGLFAGLDCAMIFVLILLIYKGYQWRGGASVPPKEIVGEKAA